jgi:hypothetical protein
MNQSRLTDDAWTATMTESQSATAESGEDDENEGCPETKRALRERAATHAADVAGEHVPDVPVEMIDAGAERTGTSSGMTRVERVSE